MNDSSTPSFEPEDIANNRKVATLAYVLFFLPLVLCPNSAFGKFHANQGLIVLIASIVLSIALFIVSFIPLIGWVISTIAYVCIAALVIWGAIGAWQGKARRLPVIGNINILS